MKRRTLWAVALSLASGLLLWGYWLERGALQTALEDHGLHRQRALYRAARELELTLSRAFGDLGRLGETAFVRELAPEPFTRVVLCDSEGAPPEMLSRSGPAECEWARVAGMGSRASDTEPSRVVVHHGEQGVFAILSTPVLEDEAVLVVGFIDLGRLGARILDQPELRDQSRAFLLYESEIVARLGVDSAEEEPRLLAPFLKDLVVRAGSQGSEILEDRGGPEAQLVHWRSLGDGERWFLVSSTPKHMVARGTPALARYGFIVSAVFILVSTFVATRRIEEDRPGAAEPDGPRDDESSAPASDDRTRMGLLQMAHALTSARDTDSVLELAAAAATPLSGSRRSFIVVGSADSGWNVAAQHGFDEASEPGRLIAKAAVEAALDDVARSRSPRLVRGEHSVGSSEWSILPLAYGREVIGLFVLDRESAEGGFLKVQDAQLLAELTASALKNAQLFEAVRSSRARYADLYDNAPDLYQTIDQNGDILDCNRTQSELLGFAKSELVGRSFASLLSDESAPVWLTLSRALHRNGRVRDASLSLGRKNGESLEVLLNASVMYDEEANPIGARVVMRDVTELKALEYQLRQSQKLEVVGTLVGGVAHDFNNILGGILGYTSLLKQRLGGSPEASKYVETIERSAQRGAELAAKLLSAAKQSPAPSGPVDVNDLVDETLELLERTFYKKVRIRKRLDPAVRPLIADAGQLQQVILNLCVNARDAMPEGGVLTVETKVSKEDAKLRLSVEDTGMGMEPSTMERLFEPFFSTKGEEGTGLGLAVVYGIVKSHGGDVRVKSSQGKGARFDIFLPIKWAEERAAGEPQPEPIEGSGELILLVDDELVLRQLGKEILEGYGYRVEAVSSGQEAVAFLRSADENVSLVILDLVMPGLDGVETYRRLRAIDAEVPVLLSSGLTAEETVQQVLRKGASGFIAKPYAIRDLTQAVSMALKGNSPRIVH